MSMSGLMRVRTRVARRVLAFAMGGAALALMCGAAAAIDPSTVAQPPHILVTGEGTATVTPDIAQVTGGVSTRAATVKEAASNNARTMTAVIDALVQAGIERKDIQTAQFSVQPVYASSEPHTEQKLVGFSVSNQVIATIRNVDKVGDVLDRLIGAGATNVWNVQFTVSEPSKALDQARRAAVADARRKAELYANAAGVTLGPVLSVTEESASGPEFMRRSAVKSLAAPTPIAVGEDTLRVSLSVNFALTR
jgi:uncharacterized protein YggE